MIKQKFYVVGTYRVNEKTRSYNTYNIAANVYLFGMLLYSTTVYGLEPSKIRSVFPSGYVHGIDSDRLNKEINEQK